jgi:hypothetical protein
VQAAQFAAKTAALELEVAASRSASKDQEIKVLNLHAVTKALRADLAELSEVVLHNTATFTQQLAESQSFMTQALSVQTNLLQSTMSKYKKEMSERRKLHNLVQELRGNIRVYARARPLSETESTTGGATYAVTVPQPDVEGEPSTELLLESSKGKTVPYQFDAVFGPESTQQQVFAQIVSLVTSVLDGYNVCQ